MKTPSRLDQTLKIRMPQQMADALERVAAVKSKERGLHVGTSTIVREALIEHLAEEERRHGLTP